MQFVTTSDWIDLPGAVGWESSAAMKRKIQEVVPKQRRPRRRSTGNEQSKLGFQRSRLRKRPAEQLITGTLDDFKRLRTSVRHKEVSYAIALVQPGISRASMSRDVIALPMAAADVYIVGGGMSEDLRIIGSASLIGGSPVPETVPPSNC